MSRLISIATSSQFEFKEKGSKFIGYAFPIGNAEEVKTQVQKIKEQHPKANHHCYAFLIKQNGEDYFIANDDGEPNNSAGMPILGQIKSFELHQVLVVVVRYFGGTKLGVGGLISAYKMGAKGCLEIAKRKEVIIQKQLNFRCSFEQLGSVLSLIDKHQLNANITHDDKGSSIALNIEETDEQKTLELFAQLKLDIT